MSEVKKEEELNTDIPYYLNKYITRKKIIGLTLVASWSVAAARIFLETRTTMNSRQEYVKDEYVKPF